MWPELDMHDLAAAEICKSYVPKAVLRQLPTRFELVGRLVSDIDRVDRRLPSVHDSAIHDGRKLLTNSCMYCDFSATMSRRRGSWEK